MTALSFVWVHPYSQNSGCDRGIAEGENVVDKVQGGRTPLGRGMKPW